MAPSTLRSRSMPNPTRKTRAKPVVSYAEPPSDDDNDEEHDEDFTSDSAVDLSVNRPSTHNTRTSARQSNKRKHIAFLSSDSELSEEELTKPPSKKRQSSILHVRKQTRVKPASSKASRPQASSLIVNPTKVIPYQSLPYHILVQIFEYAVHPLYDTYGHDAASNRKWLLRASLVCREFVEPALTALYTSPPLVDMKKAHDLLELLQSDPLKTAFSYRPKIQSLYIDVARVLAYSYNRRGRLAMDELIKYLSQLVDLEIHHPMDMAPYRELNATATAKWTYPKSMFDALDNVEVKTMSGCATSICKLRSWRWSSRIAGKKWPIENLQNVHLRPCFSTLRKIAFVNYQVPEHKCEEKDPNHEQVLAESLKVLKNLEHLVLESSTLVNAKLLPLLPANLRRLELINCWEATSDDFAAFLLTHGRQLRSLTLNHNQSLNLSFLIVLKEACPNLEEIEMDLTYFNTLASYRDSEPLYNDLLSLGQVPTWPSTLQTIGLSQLTFKTHELAGTFVQSLLNSAETLPDLRYLIVRVMIDENWRVRAEFRSKWLGLLNHVFKREWEPPQRHFSIAPTKKVDQKNKSKTRFGQSPIESAPLSSTTSTRRPQRSCAIQPKGSIYVESPDNSDSEAEEADSIELESDHRVLRKRAPLKGLTRELNILKQTAGIDGAPDGSTPALSDSDDEPLNQARVVKGSESPKQFVQGMCEVVVLGIDNRRPTETELKESDFLDQEQPGDSDYRSD